MAVTQLPSDPQHSHHHVHHYAASTSEGGDSAARYSARRGGAVSARMVPVGFGAATLLFFVVLALVSVGEGGNGDGGDTSIEAESRLFKMYKAKLLKADHDKRHQLELAQKHEDSVRLKALHDQFAELKRQIATDKQLVQTGPAPHLSEKSKLAVKIARDLTSSKLEHPPEDADGHSDDDNSGTKLAQHLQHELEATLGTHDMTE